MAEESNINITQESESAPETLTPKLSDDNQDNRRIAKNTLVLYLRMIVVMLVSLYTSRLVLDALGVEDYGIYQVVGGLVGMFGILSGSLSVSTSRFLTYALGTGNFDELKRTFATVRTVHIILAITMLVLCEFLAAWFLKAKLTIPPERLYAAQCVLQCSIISFSISLLNVPFSASVISHEKMSAFAYMSILDVTVKLLIVFMLYRAPMDRLIYYALLSLGVMLIYQAIYVTYCYIKFPECKSRPSIDRSIVRKIAAFVGWTFWGNAAVVLKDQGIVMLLNIFFGPVVNAAQGVGAQISGVVSKFIGGFTTAVQPQITKSYAAGNINRLNDLIVKSTKFTFFLMVVLMFPLINNTRILLETWLVEVPDHSVNFANIIMVYTFIDCFTTPLYTSVLATSKIRVYEIVLTILYFTNVAFTYVALKLGAPPEAVFVIAVLFKFFVLLLLGHQCYKLFPFDLKKYGKMFFTTVFPTLAYGGLISLCYHLMMKNDSFMKLLGFAIVFEVLMLPFIWFYGFNKNERQFVLTTIKGKFTTSQ